MFLEGRHVQKNKRWCEKIPWCFHQVFIDFLWKIDTKSWTKTSETLICTKNVKNNTFGTHFLAKSQFLMDFRGPSGSLGSSKRDGGVWQKPLPGAIWCHFVASNALRSLLDPFWLSSGTILTQFWRTKNCLLAVLVPWVSVVRRNARSALNSPYPAGVLAC